VPGIYRPFAGYLRWLIYTAAVSSIIEKGGTEQVPGMYTHPGFIVRTVQQVHLGRQEGRQ
jgi:hypothetical protein